MPIFYNAGEQIDPVKATVSGTVPEWLNGILLKNGPGVFDLDSGFTMNGFFDGYSVICKFEIKNGKIEFSKRYLESDSYVKAQRVGKPVVPEFSTRAYPDPSRGFLENLMGNFIPGKTDNCNFNIVKFGKTFFAMNDTSNFIAVNPADLSVRGKADLSKILGSINIMSTSGLRDISDVRYSIATSMITNQYQVVKYIIDSDYGLEVVRNANVICNITSRLETKMSTHHSHADTENYVVFIEQPFASNVMDLLGMRMQGKTVTDSLQWLPELRNRFHIVKKDTESVIPVKFESKKEFYFANVINSYEENGEIIVDIVCHDGPGWFKELVIKYARTNKFSPKNLPQSRRFIFPIVENIEDIPEGENLLKSRDKNEAFRNNDMIEFSCHVICPYSHEFPAINMKYYGKKYKYYYASGFLYTGEAEYSVIKVDVDTGETTKWFAGEGQIPSEPTFVEHPNCRTEDDGVLLICVTSTLPDVSDKLVILDANNMQLITTADVPSHIPLTCHGLFSTLPY